VGSDRTDRDQVSEWGPPVSERRLLLFRKSILKKLGLRGHLHTFRHAFLSAALTSGIPETVGRAGVGHVDADVIRLYTHIADADSQAAMRRLTANLDSSN
jgi:integrase